MRAGLGIAKLDDIDPLTIQTEVRELDDVGRLAVVARSELLAAFVACKAAGTEPAAHLSRRELLPLPEGEEGERAKERMDQAREGGPPPRRDGPPRGGDRGGRGGPPRRR